MLSYPILVPYNFIAKRVKLTWQDLKFAFNRKIISNEVIIEHSMNILSSADGFPQPLLELASKGKNEYIEPYLLDNLIKLEPTQSVEIIKDKWLYLLLCYIYINRNDYTNPLEIVELIYADFGYPETISSFVRYMPMNKPAHRCNEKNEDKLYNNWENYIKKEEKRFLFW